MFNIVISNGIYKGFKYTFPKGILLKPTKEVVRECITTILERYFYKSSCLDLFSGTASLSFEALSMGASSVVIIDYNKKLMHVVKGILKKLKLLPKSKLIVNDVFNYLKQCNYLYDIIFIDPPYRLVTNISYLLKLCIRLLKPGGIIYFEGNLSNIVYKKFLSKYCIKFYGVRGKVLFFILFN